MNRDKQRRFCFYYGVDGIQVAGIGQGFRFQDFMCLKYQDLFSFSFSQFIKVVFERLFKIRGMNRRLGVRRSGIFSVKNLVIFGWFLLIIVRVVFLIVYQKNIKQRVWLYSFNNVKKIRGMFLRIREFGKYFVYRIFGSFFIYRRN